MRGAEMCRHLAGVARLIVTRLRKADRVGVDRAAALRLHQGSNRRRIDPAGEKGAQRHVGRHVAADGVAQQGCEAADGLRLADVEPVGSGRSSELPCIPVGMDVWYVTIGQHEEVAGRQFEDAAIDTVWPRYVAVANEGSKTVLIDLGRPASMRAQRLELRAEHEQVAKSGPVERLDADSIARQCQRPSCAIPYGKSEHAVQPPERGFDAPLCARLGKDLAVAVTAKAPDRKSVV